jgi:low temperature requirement protein LtrA
MNVVEQNIKWIMLVSGVLTCSMITAVVTPEATLERTFGESISSPLANVVVRSWGVLITLIGAMLVYGAFNPGSRKLVAAVTGTSKISYAILVVVFGSQYLGKAGIVIGFDTVVGILLLVYLFSSKHGA